MSISFAEFLSTDLMPAARAYGKPGKLDALTRLANKVIANDVSVRPIREWVGELPVFGKREAYNAEQLRFVHTFYLVVEFGYEPAKAMTISNKLVSASEDKLLPLLDETKVFATKQAIDNKVKAEDAIKASEALTRRIKTLKATINSIVELREDGMDYDDFAVDVANSIDELRSLVSQEQVVLV